MECSGELNFDGEGDLMPRSTFSKEELLQDLKRVRNIYKYTPSASEYLIQGNYSIKPFRNTFGSWGNAIKEIGGVTRNSVKIRDNVQVTKITDVPIEEQVSNDITLKRIQDNKKLTDQKYKVLLNKIEVVEKERDALLQLGKNFRTYVIENNEHSKESEAVAFLIASDWHIAERVDSNKLNGLNEYNLDIAKKRAETFFKNGLRLIKIQQDVKIEKVVLALLGDFVSGNIHDELMESNYLLPIEEAIFVQNLLASGVEYLLKDKSLKEIIIPCHSGNHGRITSDRRISTEAGNSLEYFVYHQLANHFKKEPRVKFLISEGYHSYIDVYNYKIRFHHGHAISYSGGIGGITIPTGKAIAQWNKVCKVDLDCFGHYHSMFDGGNFIANGSLIGYNSFALAIKASYEVPKQAMFLIDKKRFKTIVAPILFED